jgi:hypothetical protein
MLQVPNPRIQILFDKAAESHAHAQHVTDPDDRRFWLEMEGKWLMLAQDLNHVERTCAYLTV